MGGGSQLSRIENACDVRKQLATVSSNGKAHLVYHRHAAKRECILQHGATSMRTLN